MCRTNFDTIVYFWSERENGEIEDRRKEGSSTNELKIRTSKLKSCIIWGNPSVSQTSQRILCSCSYCAVTEWEKAQKLSLQCNRKMWCDVKRLQIRYYNKSEHQKASTCLYFEREANDWHCQLLWHALQSNFVCFAFPFWPSGCAHCNYPKRRRYRNLVLDPSHLSWSRCSCSLRWAATPPCPPAPRPGARTAGAGRARAPCTTAAAARTARRQEETPKQPLSHQFALTIWINGIAQMMSVHSTTTS